MSTATLNYDSISTGDTPFEYQALHTGAIIGLVLGILSVFTAVAAANSLEGCLMTAPIPVLGMFMSLRAWSKIRREPERYTGAPLALLGFALSLAFLVGGLGFSGYVYATEVPEGYSRIAFSGMKPDELAERNGTIVPPEIAALDGKKVFIKGYIRPDSVKVSRGIDKFLLVRDSNQCCFGDLATVKYYDQILVNMAGKQRVDYSDKIFRMGGILKVEPRNATLGPMNPAPVFTLTADYAK
jgi:hypothetical protein